MSNADELWLASSQIIPPVTRSKVGPKTLEFAFVRFAEKDVGLLRGRDVVKRKYSILQGWPK